MTESSSTRRSATQARDSRHTDACGLDRREPGRGMSFEEVRTEYDLSLEDIRAALKFAGEHVEQEQFYPLPG